MNAPHDLNRHLHDCAAQSSPLSRARRVVRIRRLGKLGIVRAELMQTEAQLSSS